MTNYDRDTKLAYQSGERANEYKRYNTSAWSWGRFATVVEQRRIRRVLSSVAWKPGDRVLDIPCGTGILAGVLNQFPVRVVASDISLEMMTLGRSEYRRSSLAGVVQSDITRTPFEPGAFAAVCVLGFLHRVPESIRAAALKEISSLSSGLVILTCSVDTPMQRLKHAVLSAVKPNHVPAPCPAPLGDVIASCERAGLRLRQAFMIVPLLSAEAVLVLEKPS